MFMWSFFIGSSPGCLCGLLGPYEWPTSQLTPHASFSSTNRQRHAVIEAKLSDKNPLQRVFATSSVPSIGRRIWFLSAARRAAHRRGGRLSRNQVAEAHGSGAVAARRLETRAITR